MFPKEKTSKLMLAVFVFIFCNVLGFIFFVLMRNQLWNPYKFITIQQLEQVDAAPDANKSIAFGKEVYFKAGCAICHGVDGKGGVKNRNALNNTIPSLLGINESFGKDGIRKILLNGSNKLFKVNKNDRDPPLTMPSFKDRISEEELNNLIEYIMTFPPKEEEE